MDKPQEKAARRARLTLKDRLAKVDESIAHHTERLNALVAHRKLLVDRQRFAAEAILREVDALTPVVAGSERVEVGIPADFRPR